MMLIYLATVGRAIKLNRIKKSHFQGAVLFHLGNCKAAQVASLRLYR